MPTIPPEANIDVAALARGQLAPLRLLPVGEDFYPKSYGPDGDAERIEPSDSRLLRRRARVDRPDGEPREIHPRALNGPGTCMEREGPRRERGGEREGERVQVRRGRGGYLGGGETERTEKGDKVRLELIETAVLLVPGDAHEKKGS